ncbi:putative NBD/HSP70 family sugar kinase [Litoreibacter ponti]|uniref:Putative NBD/HSP70 family sugar kinase n=1 Tax=Litoreibacter ponti TaxID=1510457 RepID=A0A2T6BJP0_9RHOB|nr:ROK family protein [Litoreibacter ponti]PTX56283.1 putative NBD/HSP70 family sugar kinase [Litoreibacter ponti]
MPRRSNSAPLAPEGCGPALPLAGQAAPPLRQQVFERVRAAGQIPRVDVAKDLGVSPGSVTALTSELIAAGLIHEVETPHHGSARGRPPVALSVSPGARYVVGMKMGDFGHSAVVVDFAGGQLAEMDFQTDALKKDAATLVEEAASLFEAVVEKAGLTRAQISAVGVGLAGVVDHERGHVPWSPVLLERDMPIREQMSARMGLPVHIDNDTNVLTLAELWFGAGRHKSSFAVVTIEYGVGMGLVIDNQLYRGAMGLGLELGHTKVQLDGALCRCGARGCLEAYVADYALVREARVALDMNRDQSGKISSMLETLYDQAKAGNERARTIFRRAGRYLSVGLSNVVHLFDPDLIILSGERMRYDYLYAEEVVAEMAALTLDKGRPPPKIDINVWGGFVWARGGAALALSAVTDETFGDAWADI